MSGAGRGRRRILLATPPAPAGPRRRHSNAPALRRCAGINSEPCDAMLIGDRCPRHRVMALSASGHRHAASSRQAA